ncbi:MAG: hydroxysqualene dehydroxylase HpnE [Firmicutes bacterium]|nr:hydroxysqualene dehydroxylase HpnE [Bacillota bacterium]
MASQRITRGYDVAVVGAGWAGLAAAFYLAEGGLRVLLVESGRRVGGRAFSFRHPATGQWLDNGVHVLLGLCGEFQALLARAGLEEAVRFQPLMEVPVLAEAGAGRFRSWPLNGPGHLLGSVLGYGLLTPGDRLRALWGGMAIQRVKNPNAWDHLTWAEWLQRHGQGARLNQYLWEAIGTGVLNARPDELSAALALKAFRLLFKGGWRGGRLGLFRWPLGQVAEAFAQRLAERGVSIRLGEPVHRVDVEDNRVVAIWGHERYRVSYAVMAVPPKRLRDIAERSALSSRVSVPLMTMSPIVNVYLFYDRPVWSQDLALLPDEWGAMIFNRTRLLAGAGGDGETLAVSISAAQALRGIASERLGAEVVRRVTRRLGIPQPSSVQVIWQPEATFLAKPGSEGLRPGPRTPAQGLVLSGDWTRTDWPACLEGAVQSGRKAAEACLENAAPAWPEAGA